MERELKQFMLRALLQAKDSPMTGTALRTAATAVFSHVAITTGDLNQWIREMETANLIAGTADDVLGTVWMLTPIGKIKAQQLG